MFSVYFCDLPKVIEAIKTKLPNLTTFCSIRGNFFDDFVIKNETDLWVVKREEFSVWHLEEDEEHGPIWVEIK